MQICMKSLISIAVTTDDLTFAKENLLMAVTYAEEHNLTRGGCDGCVGIWYRNLDDFYNCRSTLRTV